MSIRKFVLLLTLIFFLTSGSVVSMHTQAQGGQTIPREWVDADTGHRVIRLSDEAGSQSLYFHQNAYTPDGERLFITTPTGLATVNLKTRGIDKIVDGRVNIIVVGRKTGQVY